MNPKGGYIYVMSNKNRTTLYIGVTANLVNRVYEHKNDLGSVFTKKYYCHDLIYYEFYECIEDAIAREKHLKKWKRSWKEDLIKSFNPQLVDIFKTIEGYD